MPMAGCAALSRPTCWWAVRFYEKHGFKLVTPAEKDRLLRRYWTISDRQVETSVVLADERWFASPLAR
jgi:hypothetical protein